jgi:hypothetical protein
VLERESDAAISRVRRSQLVSGADPLDAREGFVSTLAPIVARDLVVQETCLKMLRDN